MSLNNESIANNSFIDIDSIGSNDTSALLCHINSTENCSSTSLNGDWFYHNGTLVQDATTSTYCNSSFFASSGGQSVIRLHYSPSVDNDSTETGHFYCMVSDDNNISYIVNAYICKLNRKKHITCDGC